MPKLTPVPADRALRALERLGFVQVRQRGSHVVMQRVTPSGTSTCVVPMHRELKVGTLRGILHQAGVSPAEFLANV